MSDEVVVKSKEKKYRGKTLEELKAMDTKEAAKYLTARSRRSLLRHPEFSDKFIKMCEEKNSRNKKIRTHLRDVVVVPKMVGMTIGVHDGKSFQNILITIEMLGHRLGEFAQTRKRVAHSGAGIGATKGSKAIKK